jgi:hypothetical protein
MTQRYGQSNQFLSIANLSFKQTRVLTNVQPQVPFQLAGSIWRYQRRACMNVSFAEPGEEEPQEKQRKNLLGHG